jgi:hypothetical protein
LLIFGIRYTRVRSSTPSIRADATRGFSGGVVLSQAAPEEKHCRVYVMTFAVVTMAQE